MDYIFTCQYMYIIWREIINLDVFAIIIVYLVLHQSEHAYDLAPQQRQQRHRVIGNSGESENLSLAG